MLLEKFVTPSSSLESISIGEKLVIRSGE